MDVKITLCVHKFIVSRYKIVNPTTSFVYGTIADSAFTRMFRESTDPNWNRMSRFMKDYNFKDTSKAVEDLKSG